MWEPWLQAILVPNPVQEPLAGSELPAEGVRQENAPGAESCSEAGTPAADQQPSPCCDHKGYPLASDGTCLKCHSVE